MSAAGMLEGYLTQKYVNYVFVSMCTFDSHVRYFRDIFNMFTSLSNESFSGHSLEYMKKVKEFFEDQVSILNEGQTKL